MSPSGLENALKTSLAFVVLALALVFGCRAADAADLTYLAHEPTEHSAHPPLIILLHGAGADERDMFTLWSQLPGRFAVISPRAPFSDAGGGYRWYRNGPEREHDIAISRKIVDAEVDDAIKRFDADPKQVFLGGFSQGAVMVYEVVLREPGRFHGGAVLSGSMFASEKAVLAPGPDLSRTALFVGHGTADKRIPVGAAMAAKAEFARLGVPAEVHTYPGMGHETGDAEIHDLANWLGDRLEPAR